MSEENVNVEPVEAAEPVEPAPAAPTDAEVIASLQAQVAAKDAEIATKDAEVAAKDAALKAKEVEAAAKDAEIAHLRERLADAEKTEARLADLKLVGQSVAAYFDRERNRCEKACEADPSPVNEAREHELKNVAEVINRMFYNAEKRAEKREA